MMHESTQNLSLARMDACEPLFGIDAIDPDKHDVCKHRLSRMVGQRPDECEPVAAQLAAGDHHIDAFTRTQLHGDIHCVGEDCNATQQFEISCDFGCGGTAAERNGISDLHEAGGSTRDAALFVCKALNHVLE